MKFTAEAIAEFLEGEVIGNKDITVDNVSKIEDGGEGTLSFLSNMKYEHHIYETSASIVIVGEDFVPREEIKPVMIKVKDAYQAFAALINLYSASKPRKQGVSKNCSIAQSATIGEDCYIGDFAVIDENVTIGKNTLIYPNCYISDRVKIGENVTIYANVSIYDNCVIGDNCIIHSGAVIGSDGFGFAPSADGLFIKIAQIGNVVLEQDVEIGANTTIDRATMGSTTIKKGTKLDNLIQIGHNVEIGENCVAAAQVGIAGSVKLGKNCMIGGQVGIAGHISIADGTGIGSQSGISSSVKEPNQKLLGTPAIDVRRTAKIYAVTRSLPDMSRDIRTLQKEVEALKSKQ